MPRKQTKKTYSWAEAAGKYYHMHKNDETDENKITKFGDVFKEPHLSKLKDFYKGKSESTETEPIKLLKKRKNRTRRMKNKIEEVETPKNEEIEENDSEIKEKDISDKDITNEDEIVETEEIMKPKKRMTKKRMTKKKIEKMIDGDFKSEGDLEIDRENRKREVKNDYFNGGKKK